MSGAVADGVLSWLPAPDSEGRPAAMARRFGIMYMIFDRQIWGTYQMEDGWRPYNGSSPHTDHIHFSFSWDGAMQRTSWWTGAAWTGVTRGPGGPVVPLPDATSYPTLREGASGPDVQLAQKVIGVTADGVFGPATKAALRTRQSKNGVAVTGVPDEATRDAMVSNGDIPARGAATPGGALDKYLKTTIRPGSTGDSVKALQRELKVTADGAFGPQTEQAVKAFQKAKQLKVDGVVAPNVWRALAGLSYTKDGATSGTATGLDAYLTTTIRSGSRGDAVKALQRELKVTADGAFGPQTEQAVRTFQKAKQLKVDGVVTPNVWKAPAGKTYTKDGATSGTATGLGAYLTTTIRSGSRGDAVKALQRELKVTADGAFGPQTEQAVKAFQKAKQLKVDGVVAPNVWRALAGLSYTKDGATSGTATGLDAYLTTTIRSGSRGDAVKALQRELKVTADGAFGPQTEQAVRTFQKAKQLKVDGVVTPNVWKAPAGKTYTKDGATSGATTGLGAYLTTTIRSGSRGDAVKALQRELKVTADGAFGPQTEQAVRTFQKAKQLKVDGVVTPNVWKAPAGKTYTKDGATSGCHHRSGCLPDDDDPVGLAWGCGQGVAAGAEGHG
uniref:Peptidoglycan-binding protein n=1 Tax=Janibacter limosus TaxID=53458 RepID=A0AC61U2B1_9MICO|nr:peptidoglycan-binding protein [Janibacter limosus]